MSDGSGAVGLTWIGQAGYAIEAPSGELCLLDPYLSEFALVELGLPRVAPIPLDPAATSAFVVAITHTHHDHLDLITCAALAEANPEVVFVGPSSIVARLAGRGVSPAQIVTVEREETVTVGPFTFHGHYARHEVRGWLTEDALAYVVEVGGTRILHSGDTEYDMRCLAVGARGPFDVGIFVTNGSGGNMHALEAALMASQLEVGVAIPCHYGMWAPEAYGSGHGPGGRATLDPQLFADACAKLGGPAVRVLELGERLDVRPAGIPIAG
jgi:L-ascorbate 6-phosphate lactonase